VSSRLKTWLIIAGILFVLLSIGLAVLFSIQGIWAEVRDVSLVVLSVITFVALVVLCYAAYVVINLATQVKKELTPVLDSLRETTDTVRETARVANDFTITPGVKAASVLVGAAQVAGIFFGIGRARNRAEKRAQRRRELARSGELNELR
jgi:glucan phosphoethanolaminetransferase (alkaline phosphatase superfamily)